MTSKAESNPALREATERVAKLVRRRQQSRAAGEAMSCQDQQLLPFKNLYVGAGAVNGGNSAGMLRWFAGRGLAEQPALEWYAEGLRADSDETAALPLDESKPGDRSGTN